MFVTFLDASLGYEWVTHVIASFDDGDNGVYMHCNGTTASDIQAHNYYQSGKTGTNVTDGGGTQIAGMEVSILEGRIDNKTIVKQEGIRGSLIAGIGFTFSLGAANDSKGNTKPYLELGVGWGLDASLGYEWVAHKNKTLREFNVHSLEGAGRMTNVGYKFLTDHGAAIKGISRSLINRTARIIQV